MKEITFPNCARKCELFKHFGVSECESLCPSKFDKNGYPVLLVDDVFAEIVEVEK